MASDKFEVGDILVCVDDSPWANTASRRLVREKAYEVSEVRRSGDVRLVGIDFPSWKVERFRRATLDEIRKYRKEQGYKKHQFAIGELVVCIATDYGLLPSIGQTCVVSASLGDDKCECFVDIDGGKVPGRFFAACFRKATPAEAAAKNGVPADSIDSVEVGDTIVFVGPSNKNGRTYGTIATVQGVIYKSGSKIHELGIHVPGDGWSYTTPDSWVPVGRGYELLALGQPIHTGDEWLEAGRWNRTSFRTELGYTKGTSGILRRKVKEDAVTVQIGNNPHFKAVGVNFDLSELPPISTFKPTFSLSLEWEGPEKKPLTAHDAPEEISKAISLPNPQCLTSADGREFDIIDWNPKVRTGEIVKVEANLMPKLAKGPKPEAKLIIIDDPIDPKGARSKKATPFKKGDIVVCTDSTDQHVAVADRIALGRTYRIEGIDSMGFFRVGGMRGHWNKPSRFRLATPAEAQAFLDAEQASKEATEKQPPTDPGIGYRFLDKDELVVEGDELWWLPAMCWAFSGNHRHPNPRQAYNTTYRRRNQFAEGELVQIIKPATQALRDEYPKWRDAMDHLDGKVLPMPTFVWLDGTLVVTIFREGVHRSHFQAVSVNWLAPASSKQKAAFQAEKDKKAKVQELEDKMKAIESELAILKGT